MFDPYNIYIYIYYRQYIYIILFYDIDKYIYINIYYI